ncbi:hypothetical protein [Dyella tabacisoli]|uniref:DUF4013 domain-containing protein n=1 Tax=Dyella tabacisoli TaxID=2282381 RepID=A0A369USH9_9GAMM|nr:hypothetical protein [Dyella tabacisoli]RDD83427.1 hypothetical protein DVJ77_02265 [Dyella tabacisoli]
MRRVETVAADTPFSERLGNGFSYPLRGAALATCVALAISHYVVLLPGFIGSLASILVWAATWRYAADCMLHTAHGYADPPDVSIHGNDSSGRGLTFIHILAVLLCAFTALFHLHLLWVLLVLLALTFPAIDMSMAFDGNVLLALNPLNWWRIISSFGMAYLIPVAINLLLVVLIVIASVLTAMLPKLLAIPLFAFAYTYLIVLGFHLMGAMIHQRHEQFGLIPEAQILVEENKQDADQQLLAEVDELAPQHPQQAIGLLVTRLQNRSAPASIHLAYRKLLQRQGLRDGLLVHGQIWIAALMVSGESRRALGLVQECGEIDPAFLPDDPRNAGELADLAARLGMSRLALKLCRGYLATWPRDGKAPHYGLLAAQQLGERLDQPTEAIVLLGKLRTAWPDHPLRGEIDALARQLQAQHS